VTQQDVDDADLDRALAASGRPAGLTDLTLLVRQSSLLYRPSLHAGLGAGADGRRSMPPRFLGMLARSWPTMTPPPRLAVDEDWRPAWRVDLLPSTRRPGWRRPHRRAGGATPRSAASPSTSSAAGGPRRGRGRLRGLRARTSSAPWPTGGGPPAPGWRWCRATATLYQLVLTRHSVLYPIKGDRAAPGRRAEITGATHIPGRSYPTSRPAGRSVGRAAGRERHRREDRRRAAQHPRQPGRDRPAAQANPGAGALSRVAAHLDYVDGPGRWWRSPGPSAARDRPRPAPEAAHPEVTALADALGLTGAVGRLSAALEGAGASRILIGECLQPRLVNEIPTSVLAVYGTPTTRDLRRRHPGRGPGPGPRSGS